MFVKQLCIVVIVQVRAHNLEGKLCNCLVAGEAPAAIPRRSAWVPD